MQDNNAIFTEDIYSEHLDTINDVKFTPREIDVMACLLSARRTSQIASMLSIAPRTVTTHFRNIMLRLDCNSQEGIINFVERSHKLSILREYYAKLIIESAFEKSLREVSRLRREERAIRLIIYWQDSNLKSAFTRYLGDHLMKAGISAEIRDQTFDQKIENIEQSHNILLLLKKKENQEKFPGELSVFDNIDISELKNYYSSVFEILKKFLPKTNLDNICTNFLESAKVLQGSSEEEYYKWNAEEKELDKHRSRIPYKIIKVFTERKWYFVSPFLAMGLICIGILTFKARNKTTSNFSQIHLNQESKEGPTIRSDLIIPAASVRLERTELIRQIQNKLKANKGIETVALIGVVGMGGVGKTTLARHFGRLQQSSVVWELNAETISSLINSFKDLAHALAQTKKEKEELFITQNIPNSEEREKLIISFVREKLRETKDWFLIYDNVTSFSEIKNYFPQDSLKWGNGKVIITTRDSNIQNTSYINPTNVLHLEELNSEERLILFSKILYGDNYLTLTFELNRKIREFLDYIPPFPLDVSIAAYYIKNTGITFEQYLNFINKNLISFDDFQKDILKETSQYTKTRFGIITFSLERLMRLKPEFKELLFCIFLLDSQNIPMDLLARLEPSTIVGEFIYNLKKDGLITSQIERIKTSGILSFSLHRSMQSIGRVFLSKTLKNHEKEKLIEKLVFSTQSLYKYYSEIDDISNILILLSHLESIYNNLNNCLDIYTLDKLKANLLYTMGCAHSLYSRKILLAQNIFEEVLKIKDIENIFQGKKLADLLREAAAVCVLTGALDLAVSYAEKSIELCRKFEGTGHIFANNLKIIGSIYRKKNDFIMAKSFFDKAIGILTDIKFLLKNSGQSKNFTEKPWLHGNYNLKNINELEAEIYSQLGWLYGTHFLGKPEGKAAVLYAHRALSILDASKLSYNPQNSKKYPCLIAEYRWRLGDVYLARGDYDNAFLQGFKEAEHILNHSCAQDLFIRGRIDEGVGNVFLVKGQLSEAEAKFTEAIQIFNKLLGEKGAYLPRVLRIENRIRLGKFIEAYEDYLLSIKTGRSKGNNFGEMLYIRSLYYAALIKYKMKDLNKSTEHFAEFFQYTSIFCKKFLNPKDYAALCIKGVFANVTEQEHQTEENIRIYLHHSVEIFKALYGSEHLFVQDFVQKNVY